jgi:Acetyltransferase (GNAT) domain
MDVHKHIGTNGLLRTEQEGAQTQAGVDCWPCAAAVRPLSAGMPMMTSGARGPATAGLPLQCRTEPMTMECLSTTDPRWQALLDEVSHDVYHLPQYLAVSAKYEGAEAAAFYAREGSSFCLIPVLLRRLPAVLTAPSAWRDVKSPYGYAVPLFRGDEAWIDKALHAFIAECHSRNVVSAFFCMHPLLEVPRNFARHGQLVKHGETVYVDLTLTEAELWSETRERLRSYIRRLQRACFQAHFDDWSAYSDFVFIYGQTMERLQANQFYRFPVQYFYDLRAALGTRLHFCSVFDARGELACGALFTETQDIVQYHLSGTADRFFADAPSKLMLHEATLWAKRLGYKVLHLGGGRGNRADSLFHFKAGFSPLRSDFLTLRLVCDEGKYASLCHQAETELQDSEYFPRYRRSLQWA